MNDRREYEDSNLIPFIWTPDKNNGAKKLSDC
jgi:hypothetical protein